MAARKDYSSASDVRAWEKACGFKNHQEAADSLGVPVRTYNRWLAQGLPSIGMTRIAAKAYVSARMNEILAEQKAKK